MAHSMRVLLLIGSFGAIDEPTSAADHRVQAIAWYQAGRPHRAIAELDAYLDDIPDDPNALLVRAICWKDVGHRPRAAADLSAAALKTTDPQVLATIMVHRAQLAFENGDRRTACDRLDLALALEPDSVELRRLKAGYSLVLDDETALAAADSLLEADPKDSDAWYCRIEALLNLDRLDEAREALQAGQDHLENALSNYYLARLLRAEGDLEASLAALDEAIAESESTPGLMIERAEILAAQGEVDRAIEVYDSAIATQGSRTIAYRWHQAKPGSVPPDFDRAALDFEKATAARPDLRWSLTLRRGMAACRAGFDQPRFELSFVTTRPPIRLNHPDADELLYLSLFVGREEMPEGSASYRGRGDLFRETGDLEKAQSDYADALKFAVTDADRDEARTRLDALAAAEADAVRR